MWRSLLYGIVGRAGRYRKLEDRLRVLLGAVGCTLVMLPFSTHADPPSRPLPLRVVIVGSGPNPENNQVAIESNVRYVGRLLPPDSVRTTLFADGDAQRATVLYETEARTLSPGERVLGLLLEGHEGGYATKLHYRKPNLGGPPDGANRRTDLDRVFAQLSTEEAAAQPRRPLLLYFTGHGSPDQGDRENNAYDMWGHDEQLSVRALAHQIARLPEDVPVTVIMVQCFSGAFGNLLFEGGDPKAPLVNRDIAGFFATVKERMAAGCTPAVNEAEYRDFTSYFFAALTGQDRVGRHVTGADYNGDGRVGMDEAFCYALANDDSIDVPVCTSDVFLRRFVTDKDEDVFAVPYSRVRSWATPAQRAALEALSTFLNLSGEDRLRVAYQKEFNSDEAGQMSALRRQYARLEALREEGKRILLGRWPDLGHPGTPEYERACRSAVAMLTRQVAEGKWSSLLAADEALDKGMDALYAAQRVEARRLRFIRLGKSVVLAHRLRQSADTALRDRFERLLAAEGRMLLPPADTFRAAVSPRVLVARHP
ncbi:MAG TPA: hypothetical protein VFB38_10665 [Chthonomonadaceae bacterium]|nr:hypothetical protein [Chthonomonadaceae bacterium]